MDKFDRSARVDESIQVTPCCHETNERPKLENGLQKIWGELEVEVSVMYAGNASPLMLSKTAEIQDTLPRCQNFTCRVFWDNLIAYVCLYNIIVILFRIGISQRNTADCSANDVSLSLKFVYFSCSVVHQRYGVRQEGRKEPHFHEPRASATLKNKSVQSSFNCREHSRQQMICDNHHP